MQVLKGRKSILTTAPIGTINRKVKVDICLKPYMGLVNLIILNLL